MFVRRTCYNSSAVCHLNPTFPLTVIRCNTTQGILPFTISPRYFAGNKSTAATAEYCFTVNTIPQRQLVPVSTIRYGMLLKITV